MSAAAWARALLARRGDVVGINRRNVELVYPNNPRRHYPLADDKLLTKAILSAAGVPVPETLAEIRGLFDVPRTLLLVRDLSDFVVKPARGSGGAGIVVVRERIAPGRWTRAGGAELGMPELRRHLAEIVFGEFSGTEEDRGLVERRIEPHPMIRTLWPHGLSDVRVLTLRGAPLLAMVRVPTARSGGRANLHQGGLGLAVDLDSGRILSVVQGERHLEAHPDSGARLLGSKLPDWAAILQVACRAAQAFPLGYLGVDVALDQDRGPLVLEVNARPGLEIQNVHGSGLGSRIARARS